HKLINVSAIYDDCQLICKITNTALASTSDLQTTKVDKVNHGFGLENIKQALSKYNHVLKIDQSDNKFVLSFVIFNC
ncbi:MAG: GHKL domain-containing protein, partial [Clostridia bacterium]|nr:GHKL domain-containing protein [Clostridia bacterium]